MYISSHLEKLEPFCIAGRDVKWQSDFVKQFVSLLKN